MHHHNDPLSRDRTTYGSLGLFIKLYVQYTQRKIVVHLQTTVGWEYLRIGALDFLPHSSIVKTVCKDCEVAFAFYPVRHEQNRATWQVSCALEV